MKFALFHVVFLQYTVLCVLYLLIGCSAEEIQPAQLIKASSFDAEGDSPAIDLLPLNGRGILARDSIMELVFDKPVLEVRINYSTKGKPILGIPATVWKLEANQLEGVWSPQIGLNPEKDVTLTIIYEDETGIHKETLDVTLGSFHTGFPPDVFPPAFDSSNVRNNQVDADANQLNREGIKITFSTAMDPHRTLIEVYTGQVQLNWKMYWTDRFKTVILLPENNNDSLLPGQQYEVHFVDLYSSGGIRSNAIDENGLPIVLSFQTASVEPDGE